MRAPCPSDFATIWSAMLLILLSLLFFQTQSFFSKVKCLGFIPKYEGLGRGAKPQPLPNSLGVIEPISSSRYYPKFGNIGMVWSEETALVFEMSSLHSPRQQLSIPEFVLFEFVDFSGEWSTWSHCQVDPLCSVSGL